MLYLLVWKRYDFHYYLVSLNRSDLIHYAAKIRRFYLEPIPCCSTEDALTLLRCYAEENRLIAPDKLSIQEIVRFKYQPVNPVVVNLNCK